MGFIDKVKGFFYDEEEIDEEVEVPVKRQLPKKKPIVLEDEEDKKEIPERELFKAERTFNFPMDMDDEEPDFTPVKNEISNDNNLNTAVSSKKMVHSNKPSESQAYRSYSAVKTKEREDTQEKKFKPTPIISPIYGIIEGEYEKNDNNDAKMLGATKEFNMTKKIDFDTVRQKAYGKIENDYIKENWMGKEITNSVEADDDDEIEVPKITRIKKSKGKSVESPKQGVDEDAILSETKEQDLFNLIDNMYNSEEEDDE